VTAEMKAVVRPQRMYFINAWADFALIGGLSIITFILLRSFYVGDRTPIVMDLGWYLVWVVNWPHFSSTNYRLYHSRENIMQYPLTALVVPWIVLAGVFASIMLPDVVAPYFVKFFLIWSPYHFSGQTVGITMIYARRAGFVVGKLERFALSGFVFGTFLATTMWGETNIEGSSYWGIQIPGLGMPAWPSIVVHAWMWVCGILFLLLCVRWCVMNRRILPPIVLVPAIAQYVWFIPGGEYASFREFVPMFHSLQYLLIAWSMQLKEKMDREQIAPSGKYVTRETLRWGLINAAGGAFLFWGFPHLLSYGGVNSDLAFGVVAAGVQIHHFFVDGVIWKLKRQTVSSPLMVNIDDMIHGSVSPPPLAPALAGIGATRNAVAETRV
jgi:hypothetical protein